MDISREVRLELNCLSVRSEDALIRWAALAFSLAIENPPLTEYTADVTLSRIAKHVEITRVLYIVKLKHSWLASRAIRRLLFRADGWQSKLGYQLAHDAGISVFFKD